MATKPSARIEVFPILREKKSPVWRWRRVGKNNRAICQSVATFNESRYAGYAARQEYPGATVKYLPKPTTQKVA